MIVILFCKAKHETKEKRLTHILKIWYKGGYMCVLGGKEDTDRLIKTGGILRQ